jgi:hypothetical protein
MPEHSLPRLCVGSEGKSLEEKIIQVNPLLESFGTLLAFPVPWIWSSTLDFGRARVLRHVALVFEHMIPLEDAIGIHDIV